MTQRLRREQSGELPDDWHEALDENDIQAVAWITESEGCSDSEQIARLSPTFKIHISSLTTRMTMAHDPALLCY